MACRAGRQSKTARRSTAKPCALLACVTAARSIVRCTRGRLTAYTQGDICALHAAARRRTIGFTQAGLFPVAYTIGTDFRPADRTASEARIHWNRW